MKHDYHALIAEKPEVIRIVGNVEYVQNPFAPMLPIIAIDRNKKTAEDTEWRFEEDMTL